MTNLDELKICLFHVFSNPLNDRCIINTSLPLLSGDGCAETLYYMLDLSDGQDKVFDDFCVSASDGTSRNMTAGEVVDFFAPFIETDIIKNVYVETF